MEMEVGNNIGASLDENEEPPILIPCTVCGRTFKSESLKKHQGVCQKNATKKRKVFDSMKQRIQGTELAEYISIPVPPPKPKVSVHKGGTKSKVGETTHHSNTPSSSERSKPVVRSNSVSTSTPSRGAAFKEERCPHCDRTFGWKAFSRHEEWCREHKTRIAQSQSPAAVLKAKEMLEARIKYRAPLVGKLKRPTNREKYAHGAGVIGVSPMLHSYHKSTVMDVHHQKISSPKPIVSSSNKENRNKSTPKTSTVSCPGFGTSRHHQVTRKVSAPVKREPSPPKEITHIINPPWDLNISNEEVEESKESSSDSRNRKICQECCNTPFKLESNEIDLVSDYHEKRVAIGAKGILSAKDLVLEDGKQKSSKKEEIIDKFVKETVIIDQGRKDVLKCSSLPFLEGNCATNVTSNQENNINDSSVISVSDADHAKISEDSQSGFEHSNSRTQILRINDIDECPQSLESLSKEIFNHLGQGDINHLNNRDDREGKLKFQILEFPYGSNDEKQAVNVEKKQMNENIKTQQAELIDSIKSPKEKINIETLVNSATDFIPELRNKSFEKNSNECYGSIAIEKIKEKSKKKNKSLSPNMRSFKQVEGAPSNEVSMLTKTNPSRNHSMASWKNVSESNCSFTVTGEVDKSVVEDLNHLTVSHKPFDNVTSWLMEKENACHKNDFTTFSPKNVNNVVRQISITDVRNGDDHSKCQRSRLPVPLPKNCIDRSFPTRNASSHCDAKDHIVLVENGQKPSSNDFKSKYQLNNTFILSDIEKPKEFGMSYLSDYQRAGNQSNSFESSCSGTSPEIRKGIIRKCHPEDYELEEIGKKVVEGCVQPIGICSSACVKLNECYHSFNEAINCAVKKRKNSFEEKSEDNLTASPSRDSSINEVVSYQFTNLSKTWQRCKRTNVSDAATDDSKLFHVNNDQSCAKLKEVRKEGTMNPYLEGELTNCSCMSPNEKDGDNNFSLSDDFNKGDTPLLLEDLSTELSNPQKHQSTGTLTNDTYIFSTAIKKSDERILDMTKRSEACEDSDKIMHLERLNSDAIRKIDCLYGRTDKNESAENESDENQTCDPKKKFLLNSSSSTTQNRKIVSKKRRRFRSKCKNFKGKSNERETEEIFDPEKRVYCKFEDSNQLIEKANSHLNLVRDEVVTNSSVDDIDTIDPHDKNSSCCYEKTEERDNFPCINKSTNDYDNVLYMESSSSKCFSSQKVSLPSLCQKIKHRISHSPKLKCIVGKYSPMQQESSSEDNTGSGNTNCDVLSAGRSTVNNILLKNEDEKFILKRRFCDTVCQSQFSEKIENSFKDEQSGSEEVSGQCVSPQPIFPSIIRSGERDILYNQMEWLSLVQKFNEEGSNTAESNIDIQKLEDCLSRKVCKPFHYSQQKDNVQNRIRNQEKLSSCNRIVGKVSNHTDTSGQSKDSFSKEETVTEGNQFSFLQRKLAEDRVRNRLAKKHVLSPEKNYRRSHCPPRKNSPVTSEYLSKRELKSTSYKQLPSMIHPSTNHEVKVRSCQSSPSVSDLHLPKSSEDDRSAVSPMEKPSFRLSTYDPFSKAEMQLRELLSDGYESQNPKILLSSPLDEDQKKQVPDNHNSHSSRTDSSQRNGNLHLHNILNNPKQAKEDVLPDLFTETSTQLHFEMPNLMRGREETVMTKRRAMKPTALNMGIDLNPSARENPSMGRNYMSKSVDGKFDSSQEYISSPKDLEGERSNSNNSNINMESGDHLDIDSIHQSINLVALGLSNLSTNSNESLVDVDNNNAMSGEKTLAQKSNDMDSSGNLIPVDQKLVLSSHPTHRHSSGESDGDAKRVRRRKRRGKTLPEGEAREDISSPEGLVTFQNPASAKLSVDSAYSSLNRPSFRAIEDCKRAINKAFDNHQHQNSSEGENDHADEWSEDEDSKKRSSKWKPDPPVIDSTDSKLAKFCHECGSKYPLTQARFCCVCGARRLAV